MQRKYGVAKFQWYLTSWKESKHHRKNITKLRSDEGLKLETSAFQIFHGGNSTFNNSLQASALQSSWGGDLIDHNELDITTNLGTSRYTKEMRILPASRARLGVFFWVYPLVYAGAAFSRHFAQMSSK